MLRGCIANFSEQATANFLSLRLRTDSRLVMLEGASSGRELISEASIETMETISEALRDLTSEDKALAAFCSATTVKRYLVARNGNIDATITMLRCEVVCAA